MSPDSVAYLHNAQNTSLSRIRPSGYSAVLWPFTAIVLQHLLALGLVAAGYALLTSRGLNRWLAAVAVLPLSIDIREVTIEHYIYPRQSSPSSTLAMNLHALARAATHHLGIECMRRWPGSSRTGAKLL
jgi:hypothetical protein